VTLAVFSASNSRPRELRRRVLVPARVRTVAGWSDACILNVSSRGLLIHSTGPARTGSMIELRHGPYAIVGRVAWRDGPRFGLSAEDRVPVEEILTLSQSQSLPLTAGGSPGVERRKQPRTHEDSRLAARAFEFASIAVIAGSLSVGMLMMVQDAFAAPLAAVQAALGR
jgi:hypothetical protein